jgi:hypothetical protein
VNAADENAKLFWPTTEALATLEEIRDWVAAKGECAFHELSHAQTDRGEEHLGLSLRELKLRGLVSSCRSACGLVSCVEVTDPERAAYYLGETPFRISREPRSRLSPLAARLAA